MIPLKDATITFDGKTIPVEGIESIEYAPAAADVPLPERTVGVFHTEIEMTMTVEPGAWRTVLRELVAQERLAYQAAAVRAQLEERIGFMWGPQLRFAWADVPVPMLPRWLREPGALALRTAELAYRAGRPRRIPVRVGAYPVWVGRLR
jgi:hypothetical protein